MTMERESTTRIEPAVRHGLGTAASVYLDSLRAVAANLVIVSHVLGLYFGVKDPYSFGNLGVAVFFLLSGFLIMQSMLNRAEKPEPRLPGFLADRVARICTPYVPALVLIVIANFLLIDGQHGQDGRNTGLLAFLGNLLLLQDHSVFQLLEFAGIDVSWRIRSYNAAEPFWTIAIEMWIYVSMGLFFFCLIKRESVSRGYAIALALVSIPVLVWNAAAGGGKSLSLIWILGAVAGLLFHLWRTTPIAHIRSVACALVVFGVVALIGRSGKVGFQPYDFQTAALMALVLFGVLAWLIGVETVPSALKRAMTFLASYSYSLYLIHNTALIVVLESFDFESTWVRVAVGVALAHVCAYGLYIAFERHYRTVARWLRPQFERALVPREPAESTAADSEYLASCRMLEGDSLAEIATTKSSPDFAIFASLREKFRFSGAARRSRRVLGKEISLAKTQSEEMRRRTF